MGKAINANEVVKVKLIKNKYVVPIVSNGVGVLEPIFSFFTSKKSISLKNKIEIKSNQFIMLFFMH